MDDDDRKSKSRDIDKEIRREKRLLCRRVNILLLGAGESGKSTFLKQIRIIHGETFTERALHDYAGNIRQNMVMGMKVLLDAREKMRIPWRDERNGVKAIRLLSADPELAMQVGYFRGLVPTVEVLWLDEALHVAFDRRREFQLGDSVKYFLDQIARIGHAVSSETQEKRLKAWTSVL